MHIQQRLQPIEACKIHCRLPLTSDTGVPVQSLEVKASMLETCTENEVTLAIGASVPITKDEPVGEVELLLIDDDMLAPQPARSAEATVSANREGRISLP